jgi:hypothetical protein
MICRSKQLFIVIDPMYSNLGWEYDLEGVIEQHLQHRKAIKQTIQTVIGQQTIKDLFYNKLVNEGAAFLFTEASSDLVMLVNKFSRQFNVPVRTVGVWRHSYASRFKNNTFLEKRWWLDFEKACFKGLERSYFIDESTKDHFLKHVSKKRYPYSIVTGPTPASAIKHRIESIQPVEFKADMILVDSIHYTPEHKRMISLLLSDMQLPKPVSVVFAYEHGTPTREQYVQWLMNAKVVINFDVQGHIGDDVYEYLAAKCIPMCNAPGFYTNIVPKQWRVETQWFDTIGTFIDAMPIIKHMVTDAIVNYDNIRPKIDFLERKLETVFFNKESFLKKLY